MLVAGEQNPAPPPTTVAGVRALTRASERHLEFAEALAVAVWERLEEIDRCLREATRPRWRDRAGLVERNVLRVAVAELLTNTAPPRVVLTEAIEVTRRYAGEAATPFVHAVLDAAIERLGRKEPEPSPETPDRESRLESPAEGTA